MRLLLSILMAGCAWGHAISVSVSQGTFDGKRLVLDVTIPRYEAEHLPPGGVASAFQFKGAKLEATECQPLGENLTCRLRFEFVDEPAEQLETAVTLSRVTVPNHIHIMKLTRKGSTRQGVFDRTFENERIDFREKGQMEQWWRGARMGFAQMGFQPILILMLLMLGVLGRPSAYLSAAGALFFVVLPDKFYATPAFFEFASAIALSYVAIEQSIFPGAKGKWMVSAIVGGLEGAALAVLSRPAGEGAVAFGTGNLLAQAGLACVGWYGARFLKGPWERFVYWGIGGLGAAWSVWVYAKRF